MNKKTIAVAVLSIMIILKAEGQPVSLDTTRTIIVAFQDQREYVQNGKKKESFRGENYSLVGIGYNFYTTSGEKLTGEFARIVTDSLHAAGVNAVSMDVGLKDDSLLWMKSFLNTNADTLLFFTINDWFEEIRPLVTRFQYGISFNLTLKMYNRQGTLLFSGQVADEQKDKKFELISSAKESKKSGDRLFKYQANLLLKEADLH